MPLLLRDAHLVLVDLPHVPLRSPRVIRTVSAEQCHWPSSALDRSEFDHAEKDAASLSNLGRQGDAKFQPLVHKTPIVPGPQEMGNAHVIAKELTKQYSFLSSSLAPAAGADAACGWRACSRTARTCRSRSTRCSGSRRPARSPSCTRCTSRLRGKGTHASAQGSIDSHRL